MSFVGHPLYSCRAVFFNWHDAWLIVVSGAGPNFCGHAVLKAGTYYFHVDGWNRPYYMNETEYRRYMDEAGKRELFRRYIHLPDPEGAQRKLEELSVKVWYWLGVPNNCVSYVEELLSAGGANESSISNCPSTWR